jgi:hypothetical protein
VKTASEREIEISRERECEKRRQHLLRRTSGNNADEWRAWVEWHMYNDSPMGLGTSFMFLISYFST